MTRYQSDPGQATAYMIGQLQIKKARKYSKDNLGDKFSLRDFHYQVNLLSFVLCCCYGCYKSEKGGDIRDIAKNGRGREREIGKDRHRKEGAGLRRPVLFS